MVTFPVQAEDSVVNSWRELLDPMERLQTNSSASMDEPVVFPVSRTPAAQQSILTLTDSLEVAIKSPFPRIAHWFHRWMPHMRKARVIKEEMISDALEKGKVRIAQSGRDRDQATCALDFILFRELIAAEKENREPAYNSRVIYDEVSPLHILCT
jgi:hypothetical protein